MPVKTFYIREASIEDWGLLLSNFNSRNIMIVLSETKGGMYVNEIALKLELRVSVVVYHLKKLGELGFLTITEKQISKTTKLHRFFKMSHTSFVVTFTKRDELN